MLLAKLTAVNLALSRQIGDVDRGQLGEADIAQIGDSRTIKRHRRILRRATVHIAPVVHFE